MNQPQEHWWNQAVSDHNVLILMRQNSVEPCQQLHYLQMVTEKLAKAYLWRDGRSPPRSHKAFLDFLRALLTRSKSDRQKIAQLLGYQKVGLLEAAIRRFSPLAYDLERLAPSLAGDDGPNPEYPWPGSWPTDAPTTHRFALRESLMQTQPGRDLVKFIDRAIKLFEQYA